MAIASSPYAHRMEARAANGTTGFTAVLSVGPRLDRPLCRASGAIGCPIQAAGGVYTGNRTMLVRLAAREENAFVNTDLVARVQDGDEEAFRHLVEGYRRELQLHCYRILGSAQDAEDAVQETFLAAWQGIARFEARASVRTW